MNEFSHIVETITVTVGGRPKAPSEWFRLGVIPQNMSVVKRVRHYGNFAI